MSRPQKEGLDYFPLDVNLDIDDKFQLLEAQHGIEGFGIIIKLYMKIYGEGYYYPWGEKEGLLFSKRINVDINKINVVINDALRWNIFDKSKYDKYKILTSGGIQKRYIEAVKRRQSIDIIGEYIVNGNIKGDNVNIIAVNAGNYPQRKEEKRKEENILGSICQQIYDHYMALDLMKHKSFTPAMQKAIGKAIKENNYTIDDCKKLLDRHNKVVAITKDDGQYAVRRRSICEFFGQKVANAQHLICSEYEEGGKYYEKYKGQIDQKPRVIETVWEKLPTRSSNNAIL